MPKQKKTDFLKETEGKVLCPKIGHEDAFIKVLGEMQQIGNGKLGWNGQAEMMYEMGMVESLRKEGVKFPKKKEKQIEKLRHIIIGSFVDTLYEHADWVTPEEATSRDQYRTILYKETVDGQEKVPTPDRVDDAGKPK